MSTNNPFPKSMMVLLIITIVMYGCASRVAFIEFPVSEFEKKFEPPALKEDIDFLFDTMEQVHPNLYAFVSKDTISQLREGLESRLKSAMTRVEFWKEVAPCVTKLRDGHTSIPTPYDERVHLVEREGLLFPFDVSIDNGSVYIVANYSSDSTIPLNSQLLSINEKLIEEVYRTFMQYAHGERISFRHRMAEHLFPRLFWFLYGFESGYNVEVRSPNGDRLVRHVNGITGETFRQKRYQISSGQTPIYYSYRAMPGEKTALIDITAFTNLDKFESFLQETFQKVHHQSVENLVIDIRRNGGGNSQLGDALLNYLTHTPYFQMSSMEIKKSKQIEKHMRLQAPWYLRWIPSWFAGLFFAEARKFLDAQYGELITYEAQLKKPKENPLRFKGNVYVLIGASTFSSATAFAAAIKDFQLGTLIGEETGGLATSFGDIYYFQLPNTKLLAGVSSKRFVRPSGSDDGQGVIPDYEVTANPEDRVLGKDPVMKFSLNLIKSRTK